MFLLRWISTFFKFVIKELFSFTIKLIFLIFLIVVGITFFISKKEIQNPKNVYLTVDLSKDFKDNLVKSPFSFKNKSTNFYQLLNKISLSKADSNVLGIVLYTDRNTLSRTQIVELGEVLKDFKLSNKPIYSYATHIDNNSLLLNSFSTISVMSPSNSTTVNVTGYSRVFPYYKNLSEKLGIDVEVIHVGDFKTYGENFTRDKMSSENKNNLKRILNEIYAFFVIDISKNLSLDWVNFNNLILAGDLMGESSSALKNLNLISQLNYWDDFKKEKKLNNLFEIENYNFFKINNSENKIAIIYLDGEILQFSSKSLSSNDIIPEKVTPLLEKASKDENIKGVVLRINSPGGSALASDLIYNSVKNINKPVYVSIGSVAASGGYYISSAANKIFAEKESITGSIGVVSLIPNFKNLTDKIGVNLEEVSLGKYSDLYSLTIPMSNKNREKIYQSNLKVYDEFLKKVSSGRNLSLDKVKEIAQGKVWTGEEALKNGLVDSIGGINFTIKTLANDLNISKNYEVIEIAYEESFKDVLESNLTSIQSLLFFKNFNTSKIVEDLIKKEELFYKPIMYLKW